MNDNCLAGMQCPKCRALEPFVINVTTNVTMYDEGGTPDGNDLDWDKASSCTCPTCEFHGEVADFMIVAEDD